MTDRRFDVVEKMLTELNWDFFMLVEMGVDRIHHGFWRYHAADHRLFEPGNRFEHAIRDYYRHIDQRIAAVLARVPDDTVVFVVSDHGAKTMHGGVCINDWLRREGYLTLNEEPDGVQRFDPSLVDWSRTRVWGEGGYYGRIFVNMAGREPQGTVDPDYYDSLLVELKHKLESMTDENGKLLGTRAYRPAEVYERVTGYPPALIVYFGDLSWRSIGSVGNQSIHVRENDTGPDDANHAPHGMCIYANPALSQGGPRDGLHLFDIGRTVLDLFHVPAPAGMHGQVIRD
jgi:predicted AlkP superfamily phosphohydrolase/phosphomutase